jgi:hypothetical protein
MGLLHEVYRMAPAVILADGIDFSLLIVYGAIVLVPLMVFQVAVEGGILSRLWGIPFKQLTRAVFVANCWSLVAGIPTKILNAWLYNSILPNDLLGFFKYYPFAAVAGTFVYFAITVFVEGFYLSRCVKEAGMPTSKFWKGVVVANLATYAVLAPLNYFGTRPDQNIKEFTSNTSWAAKPPSQILYIDSESGHLKSIFSDGSNARTLVSSQVTNYVVASNLQAIVFQDRAGVQRTYQLATGQNGPTNADLQLTNSLNSEHHDQIAWQVSDETGERRAWAEPGLGNSLYVYRTNHDRGDSVRVAVNPGLLHLPNFRFSFEHPVFISGGRECLFQSGEFIYVLDIENRRVGKLAHGTNFALPPERRIR